MTLEEAQASLTSIETALANASLQVMFSDRSVMYKSNSDLMVARDYFAGQVAKLSRTRSKQALGYSTKGYC